MEAKDTVMDKSEIEAALINEASRLEYPFLSNFSDEERDEIVAKAQAEISFKAGCEEGQKQDFIFSRGYKAGRKEGYDKGWEDAKKYDRKTPT